MSVSGLALSKIIVCAPEFEFVRGISEYLPWPDGSFSTVISATSLDHCLSLNRSLAELERVLRPGGRFLLWIASVPGSPPYEPEDPAFVPADQFHLFHFDVSWFEPAINQVFETVDRVELRKPQFSEIMYCLRKREKVRKNLIESDVRARTSAPQAFPQEFGC